MRKVSIIDDGKKLEQKLCAALAEYQNVAFAVAWAREGSDFYKKLKKHKKNIVHSTIGTNFFLTSPSVLQFFEGHKGLRVCEKNPGVFHPKIYLFWNETNDNIVKYTAIIGSANLTFSAFNKNAEVCVKIVSNGKRLFDKMLKILQGYFNDGKGISEYVRVEYEKKHDSRKNETFFNKIIEENNFLQYSWDEFLEIIEERGTSKGIEERRKALKKAHEFFSKSSSFMGMDDDQRKCIAGTSNEKYHGTDFRAFGSMSGSGKFAAIMQNKKYRKLLKKISDALENIPLAGKVTFDDYMRYIEPVIDIDGVSVGCATRLLAMKRPDYFFCLNGKNKKNICNAFNIQNTLFNSNRFNDNPKSYWKLIIEPIIDKSRWWSGEYPAGEEPHMWDYRMAMMDIIFVNRE